MGLAGASILTSSCAAKKEYDILISKGLVYDGLGTPGKEVDIAIKGDRIVAIESNINKDKADMVIDATGYAVSPGFLDAHSHTDFLTMINPKAESKIRQGVTTDLGGNCGYSYFSLSKRKLEELNERFRKRYNFEITWGDINDYFAKLEEKGMALNNATFIGHHSVRDTIIGPDDREPTEAELILMKKLVRDSMQGGALGLSSGLYYAPGSFAKTEEVIELCHEIAPFKGVYATHMRDEGDFVLESIDEAIRIARESKVSLQISHLKAQYPRNYWKMDSALSKIEDAKKAGMEILADRYPYRASSTSLSSFFPRWSQDGTIEDFVARLQDKSLDKKLRAHLKKQEEKEQTWANVLISSIFTEKNKIYEGKNVLEGAKMAQKSPYDFMRDILIEERGDVHMVNFSMSEENLKNILAHPLTVIGSDGGAVAPYGVLSSGKPHPRLYGTFPRVLGKFARDEKLFSQTRAVQKMTSMSAEKFGIKERGQLTVGYFADIVLFDPDKVIDKATWLDPHQYPAGIDYVIVNGQIVINQGEHTGALPGRVIKNKSVS